MKSCRDDTCKKCGEEKGYEGFQWYQSGLIRYALCKDCKKKSNKELIKWPMPEDWKHPNGWWICSINTGINHIFYEEARRMKSYGNRARLNKYKNNKRNKVYNKQQSRL